jgi:hypothetical protein
LDTDTSDDTDTDTEVCAESDYPIVLEKIDVMIVIDRSNSMESFWDPVGDAIAQVVKETSERINFSAMFFPTLQCKSGDNGGDKECLGPQTGSTPEEIPAIPFGTPDADQVLSAAFDTYKYCGGTPTAETLKVTKDYMTTVNDGLAHYVMLATDGAPNCNPNHETDDMFDSDSEVNCICTDGGQYCGATACLDDVETCTAAEALYNAGYPMFVVGYQVPAQWVETMNAIADKGSGGQSDYYPVEDPQDLIDAFQKILDDLVSCEFKVDWDELDDNNADLDNIDFFCKEHPDDTINQDNWIESLDECKDGEEGWIWVDGETVQLCDATCQELKDGVCTNVVLTVGCENIIPE